MFTLKNAIKNLDTKKIEELLKGKQIQCSENANGVGKINPEDLSLYQDVVMVRDRIWAPESLTRSFFNNLHLGHRAVGMMKRLALRSVYWSGIAKDLEDYYNECYDCNQKLQKNKEPEPLPEEKTFRPYECISMDGFETYAPNKEHGLAIIDKHTGYVWAMKSGDMKTGTAHQMKLILQQTVGSMMTHVKRMKTDGAKNLCEGAVKELCQMYNIYQDKSSAHHASGNLCIENAVQRIKNAIGARKIEDSYDDILALNHGNPYHKSVLTPCEEITGLISPVPGIPMTDKAEEILVDRKILGEQLTRAEFRNTNPRKKALSPEDTHPPTKEENNISKDWVEKVNQGDYKETLTCGDRVYYVDHPRAKGLHKWRSGIIIKRKPDCEYYSGPRASNGYEIWDVEKCTTVSRTRAHIRKFKHTKVERELLEGVHKHIEAMRKEYFKPENKDFLPPTRSHQWNSAWRNMIKPYKTWNTSAESQNRWRSHLIPQSQPYQNPH